jgi:hypothetical protein
MRVYKVVSIKEGKFFSAVTRGKFSLEYKIGEKTIPEIPHSLLMAFKFKSDAGLFGRLELSEQGFSILEAEAEEIHRLDNSLASLSWPVDEIRKFWLGAVGSPFFAPAGTIFCKSITPIRELGKISVRSDEGEEE